MQTTLLIVSWSLLLLVLLGAFLIARKWKVAFADRDWTLTPTLAVSEVATTLMKARADLEAARQAAIDAREATAATQEEFGILGRELDARTNEVRELRMGQAFSAQRPFMAASVRALDAIAVDSAAGSDPQQTIRGIEIELRELLEDHGVEVVTPSVGSPLPARGVDPGSAKRVPTPDASKVGTIAAIQQPAYIATGPGSEIILKPADVTIYVGEADRQ